MENHSKRAKLHVKWRSMLKLTVRLLWKAKIYILNS